MICYTCEKFIKKGHGKNIYYYAGQWRYYCFFCLRSNDVTNRINQRRKSYLFWVSISALILFASICSLPPPFALFAVLPIIGAITLWQLKIRPKLDKLDKKDWEPILRERAEREQLENLCYSLKKGERLLFCWKCLVAESEKYKEKKFRRWK